MFTHEESISSENGFITEKRTASIEIIGSNVNRNDRNETPVKIEQMVLFFVSKSEENRLTSVR